jgi:hypothetical protein
VIARLHRARVVQAIVLALAVLAAATPADDMLQDFVFRHFVSHEVRLLANGFTLLGTTEVATVGLLALAVVSTRREHCMWQAAVGGMVGAALAGLTTRIVKRGVSRPAAASSEASGRRCRPTCPRAAGSFTGRAWGRGLQRIPVRHATTAFAAPRHPHRLAPARRRGRSSPRRRVGHSPRSC